VEKQKKAYILGIAAVLIWSTVASAFKVTLGYMDPWTMVVLASIVSTATLFLILIIQGKFPMLLSLGRKRTLKAMIGGALNPFLYYIVLFWTYDLLKAQEAQPLNYTWPIILTILSMIFLKQRIRKLSIIAILISFAGIVVISFRVGLFSTGEISHSGVALGLFSAVIWAVYWTISLKDRTDGTVKLFLNFLFGTILVTVFVLGTNGIRVGGVEGLVSAAYVGVFEMGLTFILWLKALEISESTSKISNLIYLSPFVSLFLIAIVVGEAIMLTTVIGLILIMAGVVLQRVDDKRKFS